jgi:hypothetical protein
MYEEDNEDEDLVYVMEDTSEFINQVRRIVFAGFGLKDLEDNELSALIEEIDKEEMDKTISFAECKIILQEYIEQKKIRRKIKYVLTSKNFDQFIEAVNARLVSNLITELVDMGQLDSAWDSEANDFIFWIPDNKIGE